MLTDTLYGWMEFLTQASDIIANVFIVIGVCVIVRLIKGECHEE